MTALSPEPPLPPSSKESSQSRALRIYAIHARVISYLDYTSLQAAARVNTTWYALAAKRLYSHVSFANALFRDDITFAWPLIAARPDSTLHHLSTDAAEKLRWARSVALNSIRVVSIAMHSHASCGDFVFPTSLDTPGIERPILTLRLAWDAGRGRSDTWKSVYATTCALAECFNPEKIVLHQLGTLSTDNPSQIPCIGQDNTRVRKLCFILDPPKHTPGFHRAYADLPATIRQIVVHLRKPPVGCNGHVAAILAWSSRMRDKSWGADVLARHFGNVLLYLRGSGRRVTFVGCEQLDLQWMRDCSPHRGMQLEEVGADGLGGPMEVFSKLVHSMMEERWRTLPKESRGLDGGPELELVLGIDVEYLMHEEYLARGDTEGELIE